MSRTKEFSFQDELVKDLEPKDQIEQDYLDEVNKALKPFCTVSEMSDFLKVSRRTVYELINSELLIAKRVVNREKLIYTKSILFVFREEWL